MAGTRYRPFRRPLPREVPPWSAGTRFRPSHPRQRRKGPFRSAGTRSSPSQFRPHRPREVPSRSAHTRSRPSRPRRPREVPSRRPSRDPVPVGRARFLSPLAGVRSHPRRAVAAVCTPCAHNREEQGVSKHTVKMRKTGSPPLRTAEASCSLRFVRLSKQRDGPPGIRRRRGE